MTNQTLQHLEKLVENQQKPHRRALSSIFPSLKEPILAVRINARHLKNKLGNLYELGPKFAKRKQDFYFDNVVARHQSLLLRKLGSSDMRLQHQKITNLKLATQKLDGLVIMPGETFSFWETVGKPTAKKGYVNGMLLAEGKVVEGMGGGLCQMSNLLCWLFMHAPVEITERHHHAFDAFPDSGRVLPFGSGATILYNFIDLKIKNISDQPLQLKVWLTDKHLKAQLVSDQRCESKFHMEEQNHCFIKRGEQYFRFNEIWRSEKIDGELINREKMATNFAPVNYAIDQEYLARNNFELVVLDKIAVGPQQEITPGLAPA